MSDYTYKPPRGTSYEKLVEIRDDYIEYVGRDAEIELVNGEHVLRVFALPADKRHRDKVKGEDKRPRKRPSDDSRN